MPPFVTCYSPHPHVPPHALVLNASLHALHHQIIWRPSVEILKEEGIEVEVTAAEEEEERQGEEDGTAEVSSAIDTSSLVVVHESGVK